MASEIKPKDGVKKNMYFIDLTVLDMRINLGYSVSSRPAKPYKRWRDTVCNLRSSKLLAAHHDENCEEHFAETNRLDRMSHGGHAEHDQEDHKKNGDKHSVTFANRTMCKSPQPRYVTNSPCAPR